MKKYIISGIFLLAFICNLSAQDAFIVNAGKNSKSPRMMWNFDYSLAFPMGDLKDFIDKPDYYGLDIDGRSFIKQNFSVGGGIGINFFDKKFDRTTYYFDGGAITGTRWNYFYQMPFFANAHYYPLQKGKIKPFVGLNAGAYYTEYEVQMGLYAVRDKNWHFGLAPEIGFYLPFGISDWAINVKAKYNYVFYDANNITGLQSFGINIGLSFIP